MALAGLRKVTIGFGGLNLLEDADLQIEEDERVCLLGRNGSGKTTLLRLLNGELKPDSGKVESRQDARIRILPQRVPQDLEGTVYNLVAEGLDEMGDMIKEFHEVSTRLADEGDNPKLMKRLDQLHEKLSLNDGWSVHQRVDEVIDRLKLDPEMEYQELSGGLKRRVLLGRALVAQPDLLLLDEPTNHLDIDSIRWLEEFLMNLESSILFVTHDRRFLRKIATRIVELDRGMLNNWDCDYETYLQRKQAALEAERKQWKNFKKKIEREEEWLSRTPKARKQRNMGRVRKLQEMRQQKRQWRKRPGKAKIRVQDSKRSGDKVIEAKNIAFSYDDMEKPVIRDFTTTIMRGDKIGIVGPNGSGKTTLIRLLLKGLEPDQGSVEHGTKLEVGYFDQHRAQFDEEKPVYKNVVGEKDVIEINGYEKHVIGYLEDFLFSKKRAKSPVKLLSGGERNRLMLANLFARQVNFLVMDEPTNDLDTDTLELLEQKMVDFDGTILLVSHDRDFLENVVTGIFAMQDDGRVREFVGGYDDWIKQRESGKEGPTKEMASGGTGSTGSDGDETGNTEKDDSATTSSETSSNINGELPEGQESADNSSNESTKASPEIKNKLSYNEKRELERLPGRIEELEAEQQGIYDEMSDPSFYERDQEDVMEYKERLQQIEQELEEAYDRWQELETINER